MAKYVLLFVGFAVLCTAFALECYNCATRDAQDKSCNELNNIQTTICGKSAAGHKSGCLKSIFKEKATQVTNTTRKCVILADDGKTDTVCKAEATQELVFCDVCYDEKCNGSTMVDVNVFTMLGAIASLLVAKYFLH